MSEEIHMEKPVVLCILDGWGLSEKTEKNAIALAHTPHWTEWLSTYPMAALDASGNAVGLPHGQMGNSEVGHMTIGAGRPIFQELPRITKAFAEQKVGELPSFQEFTSALQATKGTCHVMGLFSPGGVHSHQDHILEFVALLVAAHIPVALHLWLDGRDTPPQSAADYMAPFMEKIAPYPSVSIVTLAGRYYAMDRDKRWDRTKKAYEAIVHGEGSSFEEPLNAIRESYGKGVTDEFLTPVVAKGYMGLKEGDAILVANFRADRVRQLLAALVMPDFKEFDRDSHKTFPCLGMTPYAAWLIPHMKVLFHPEDIRQTLGSCVAAHHKKQFRIAETEKYAHITFFFNGGREEPFPQETRVLIPSPKVATYDLQPEMSSKEVTEKLLQAIEDNYDFLVVNYANPDMVGHTGNLAASIKAVEVVDACLGQIAGAVLRKGGALIITADHGNIEKMEDEHTHAPHTAHTTNFVPFMVISEPPLSLKKEGTLADIAPTLLELMGLPSFQEMMGKSLLKRQK